MQIHVAHRDIFTAVVVSRVLETWGEKSRVFFTSLTCSRSLFSEIPSAVAALVCGTRGGGNTGSYDMCHGHDVFAHTTRTGVLRPILASHSERELRQHTRYTTTRPRCDAGDRHPQQIGDVDISLSTPITTLDFVRCASP